MSFENDYLKIENTYHPWQKDVRWINADLVDRETFKPDKTPIGYTVGKINKAGVNVRMSGSKYGSVIDKTKSDEIVYIKSENSNGWYGIAWKQGDEFVDAYIFKKYVDIVKKGEREIEKYY